MASFQRNQAGRIPLARLKQIQWLVLALVFAFPLAEQSNSFPQNSLPASSGKSSPVALQESGTSQPVLRGGTHLVLINVVAQDKKGNPVTGLDKKDFVVLDQGKPQEISVFSEELLHVQSAPGIQPPANVFSNHIDEQSGTPTSVTVILIDALNTHFTDMANVRMHLANFLKQLQPEDRIALYGLTTHLSVLHDFTRDAASLRAALDRTPNVETPQIANSDFDPSNTGNDDLDGFLDDANQKLSDFNTINRADATAQALESIADHIAPLPGRKNLIWVSGGFPIDLGMETMDINSTQEKRSFSDEVERAARALNNANVAVYPVDARGLIGMPSVLGAASRGPSISPPSPLPNRTLFPSSSSQRQLNSMSISPNQKIFDTMNILADRTGGRAFYNNNDIQSAIRRAIDDSKVTYVLGYYPDHNQWNGKFHEIKIKLDRSGVNIHYRRGYFAFPDQPPTDEKKLNQLVRTTVESGLDSSDLGISVQARPVTTGNHRSIGTTATIDARNLALDQKENGWAGTFHLFYVQAAQDKVLHAEARKAEVKIPQNDYQNILKTGMSIESNVDIVPGATRLRIIVVDATSGTKGSVTIPLDKVFPAVRSN